MNSIYLVAPKGAIPKASTNAAKLLSILLSTDQVPEMELALEFKSNQRSPIQELGSDSLCNWLIHPIRDEAGKIVARQLDERHLSGERDLDANARMERKKQLKERSYSQARLGRIREPKARSELNETLNQYNSAFEEAANDSNFESKKPTEV